MLKGVSESFKKRADPAAFWEAWVGAVLARAGLFTVHYPFVCDGSDEHGLSFDLEVSSCHPYEHRFQAGGLISAEVDVKSLSLSFSNVESYPFDSVILCSQNSFLRKWPGSSTTKRDFLLLSTDTGSLVWVPVGTPVILGGEVYDKSRHELYRVAKVQKSDLREFSDFVELFK